MKKIFSILAVATLLMVGCEKGEDTSVVNPDEIRFETSIATRVAGTAFEEGDTFGLYAVEYDGDVVADLQVGGNYLNNEAVTLTGGIWKPARTLYWSANPCDFYAKDVLDMQGNNSGSAKRLHVEENAITLKGASKQLPPKYMGDKPQLR